MLHIKHSWNNYQIGRWYIWSGLQCVDDFGRTVWNECNHCSAGPCGKGNVTGWADWPSHVVQVQYTLGWPMQNGYNHPFGRHWLACVDWAIVKSGGPCGTGSSTEGAGHWRDHGLKAFNFRPMPEVLTDYGKVEINWLNGRLSIQLMIKDDQSEEGVMLWTCS